MSLTPTTLTAVINKVTDVLHLLTPGQQPDKGFERAVAELPLRLWAVTNQGEEIFRKFEVVRSGPRLDPGCQDPQAVYITRELRVTIAYPAKIVGLYGLGDLDDLEDLAEDDATKIRDAIYSPGNLIASCQAMVPEIQELERGDPGVWFQDVLVRVHLFVSQTLT